MTQASLISDEIRQEINGIVAGMPDDVSCIATGSIIEGFGNANSDIDLYVVHETGKPGQSIAIGMRKTRSVDCEFMTHASIKEMRVRIEEHTWESLLDQTIKDLDRYYRMSIGVPVIITDAFRETFGQFRADVACAAYGRWALLRAHSYMSRGSAALALGESFDAALLLKEAALWEVCARLASRGEGYPNPKWAGEKAARQYGRDTAEYRELMADVMRPEGDCAARLDRLRQRVRLDDEPAALIAARSAEFADRVRFVADQARNGGYLVRAGRSVIELDPLSAAVCARLGSGEAWADAIAGLANDLRIPAAELGTAAWHVTGRLRDENFIQASSGKGVA